MRKERMFDLDGRVAYKAEIFCCNCNSSRVVYVPKGTTVKEYKKEILCYDCGCRMDGGE